MSAAASWLVRKCDGASFAGEGVRDEQLYGAASLEEVAAGVGKGLSRRLASGRGGEDWERGAVQDRAAARGQVVDDSLGLGLRLGLLGGKRCQRVGGADPDPPVRLPVCLGRLQGAAQHLDRVALGGESAFPLADRGGLGLRAPVRRRRRLAIPDASAGTGLGLSRLGLLDPLRERRRCAPDLGGGGAER